MIELPALPYPTPLPEVTLFAFDDWAFPFYDYAEIHLTAGPTRKPSSITARRMRPMACCSTTVP
jgi:hypothetical protein